MVMYRILDWKLLFLRLSKAFIHCLLLQCCSWEVLKPFEFLIICVLSIFYFCGRVYIVSLVSSVWNFKTDVSHCELTVTYCSGQSLDPFNQETLVLHFWEIFLNISLFSPFSMTSILIFSFFKKIFSCSSSICSSIREISLILSLSTSI